MPSIEFKNLLSDVESMQIVYGFMAFERINNAPYSQMAVENDHFAKKAIIPPPSATHNAQLSFEWSIVNPQVGTHNYAILRQQVQGQPVYVYHESLQGDNSGTFCLKNPQDSNTLPIEGIKIRRDFRQHNGADCGYCAAFFIIHVIKQFEQWRQAGELQKTITDVPVEKKKFFAEISPPSRILAIFYANCAYFKIPKVSASHTPDWGIAGERNTPSYPLLREFLKGKLEEEKISAFIQQCFIRQGQGSYDEWLLHRNILLYLLIYHRGSTCRSMANDFSPFIFQNLYQKTAKSIFNEASANNRPNVPIGEVGNFFSCRPNYAKIAERLSLDPDHEESKEESPRNIQAAPPKPSEAGSSATANQPSETAQQPALSLRLKGDEGRHAGKETIVGKAASSTIGVGVNDTTPLLPQEDSSNCCHCAIM